MIDSELFFWAAMTLFFTMLMSFYSTQEMACISTNNLRLEHYKNEKKQWAIWITELKNKPTLLFSTTLIGVNLTLMISSECARRLFISAGFNPNISPFFHVPFVLLFGELIPMFAARLHAEHISRLGSPLLYLSAKICTPVACIIDSFFNLLQKLFKSQTVKESTQFMSKEELQKLLEEHEIGLIPEGSHEFSTMVNNILSLRNKSVQQLMNPISQTEVLSQTSSLYAAQQIISTKEVPYILIYEKNVNKVLGALDVRDLIGIPSSKRILECTHPVTFTSETGHALDLFLRMEEEKSHVAVVLNTKGELVGSLSINDLYDELFSFEKLRPTPKVFLEKSFSGDMEIAAFNSMWGFNLETYDCTTLGELVQYHLGRTPQDGDILFIDPLEITVTKTSLFTAKELRISTM